MSAQSAANWKKRMHSSIAREAEQIFRESKSGYARYAPGLDQQQLKPVLDFHQRDPSGAALPKKSKLEVEIRRFVGASLDEDIKRATNKNDLIQLLCRAIGHRPRRWLSEHSGDAPRKYHRFGLTFPYDGPYPKPEYRPDLKSDELRAMLELHPTVKITVPQLKAELRERDGRAGLKGSKSELLLRLRACLGMSERRIEANRNYTSVPCWEDERAARQAELDAERAAWRKEVEDNPEWKALAARSAASRGKWAAKEKAKADAKKNAAADRERQAQARPWSCEPYDPAKTKQSEMEACWRQNHSAHGGKLSFAYSGRRIPPPEAFGRCMVDWRASEDKYGHHLLAYLEVGYGTFEFLGPRCTAHHKYMYKEALKEIHGRICHSLSTSHEYAVQALRRSVSMSAGYRFRNGL